MKIMFELSFKNGEIRSYADVLRKETSELSYAVVGAGRFDGRWIDQFSDIDQKDLESALENPAAFSLRLAGGVVVAVINSSDHTAVMINDPLAAAPLLVRETSEQIFVSTDIDLLYGRSIELGKPLKKNPYSVASMLVTGVTGMGWSPYQDIEILPLFRVVSLNNGKISRLPVDISFIFEDLKKKSYEQAIHEVREEISRNFHALDSARKSWKLTHLTGGFDSRLVFSFLIAHGMEDNFVFACHGTPVERDREVFESLAKHFNLQVAPRKYLASAGFPKTLEEELSEPLEHSWGMSFVGPTRYSVAQDGLILSGGYGEALRSSYWNRNEDPDIRDKHMLLETIYGGNIKSFGGEFVNEEFLALQADHLWKIFEEGRGLGLSDAASMEYLYLYRNRMFVGMQSHLQRSFHSRFDPLYSLKGAILGLLVSNQDRNENAIGIDLMKLNEPILLSLPFDYERIPAEVRSAKQIPTPIKAHNSDAQLQIVDLPTLPQITSPPNYSPRATPEQVEFAKAKKASLRQVVWAEPVREKLRNILVKIENDEEFQVVFNVQKLTGALQRPFHNRVLIRSMINLYALLLWYRSKPAA